VCPASARRGVTANRHETWVAGCDGRKGVERATFARTNDTSRTAEACGSGTPGLVLSLAGDDPRGDGDYEVTDTGESTHNAVKTIAQGRPGVPAEPVVNNSCAFLLHTRLRVQPAPGFPCALCSPGGQEIAKLGQDNVARLHGRVRKHCKPFARSALRAASTTICRLRLRDALPTCAEACRAQ
jgi:hypothetical protein